MRLLLSVGSAVALVAVAGPVLQSAAAQAPEHQAAYRAIRATPVGALPPVLTTSIGGTMLGTAQLALRVGYSAGDHGQSVASNYAVTGLLPAGLGGTVSVTGGVRAPACGGCSRGLMLALGADRRLGSLGFGETRFPLRATFGTQGELGYTNAETGRSYSAYFGVPIATVIGGPNMDVMVGRGFRVVGFATPGVAFSREAAAAEAGESLTGWRFLLGAGVGVFNPAWNLTVNLGIQQIAIDPGEPQFGIVVAVGGR